MSVERRAGWLFLLGNLQYLLAEATSAPHSRLQLHTRLHQPPRRRPRARGAPHRLLPHRLGHHSRCISDRKNVLPSCGNISYLRLMSGIRACVRMLRLDRTDSLSTRRFVCATILAKQRCSSYKPCCLSLVIFGLLGIISASFPEECVKIIKVFEQRDLLMKCPLSAESFILESTINLHKDSPV